MNEILKETLRRLPKGVEIFVKVQNSGVACSIPLDSAIRLLSNIGPNWALILRDDHEFQSAFIFCDEGDGLKE